MSKNIALQIENISKQYRLGEVGTGTLSHDLNRWWSKIRGKEDPFAKVVMVNDRSQEATEDYIWALKNINLEVEQGEILGIIGNNGAGKSTLLKILSRVTSPTTGAIRTKGRVASLLEVGTGFHPELTGRENIYLNGTILGMTKAEVRSKLDEIIEFAGIAMYVDTPVKRYSSGMKVRLGFAVAAHLEPEILIIDEVLAVGDAAFQVKAIGKMKEISEGEGRTVLLVSHNMASISKLCKKCMVLKHGQTDFYGSTEEAITHYLQTETINSRKIIDVVRHETAGIKVHQVTINQQESTHLLIKGECETIELTFDVSLQTTQKISMKASLENALGQKVVFFAPGHFDRQQYLFDLTAGRYQLSAKFTLPYLNKGVYYLSIYLVNSGVRIRTSFPKAVQITCLGVATKQGKTFNSTKRGAVVLMGSMAAERYETLNSNARSSK